MGLGQQRRQRAAQCVAVVGADVRVVRGACGGVRGPVVVGTFPGEPVVDQGRVDVLPDRCDDVRPSGRGRLRGRRECGQGSREGGRRKRGGVEVEGDPQREDELSGTIGRVRLSPGL